MIQVIVLSCSFEFGFYTYSVLEAHISIKFQTFGLRVD